MRKRLPEERTRTICGSSFHPWRETQQTCSRTCYHVWWKKEVKDDALSTANAVKRELAARGQVQERRGSHFYAENPSGRSPSKRKQRDQEILDSADIEDSVDEDDAWAQRAKYWESVGAAGDDGIDAFNARKVEQPPLTLNGHGVQLRVHNGCLVVRNGFTHYPQDNPEIRFFPGDKKLPSRIIALDNDGSLTFDAIAWLSRHRVPLVVLNWQGEVVSVSGDGAVYDPVLREAQLAARTNRVGLTLATDLIRQKVAGQQKVLRSFWRSPARDNGLRKLQSVLNELEREPASIDALRMIEARAALAYFLCWYEVPIQWKGIGRKPIPDEWHRCGLRKGINLDGTNRHATHPVNAMLNYGYRVLESQVRIQAVAQGLDPIIGYSHASQGRRPALVFDLMEPLRPQVDHMVLDFVRMYTFSPSDFAITPTGVCRIHPQLARRATGNYSSSNAIERMAQEMISTLMKGSGTPVELKRAHASSRSGRKAGRPTRLSTTLRV